jgi:hypothetical protein
MSAAATLKFNDSVNPAKTMKTRTSHSKSNENSTKDSEK